MTRRSLIGVIDLFAGRAVHAVAGRRDEYRDAVAHGIPPGDAIALADRYEQLGVDSLYVADLDAITGAPANLDLLTTLSARGNDLWIDAGAFANQVSDVLASNDKTRFIVPTESFGTLRDWTLACETLNPRKPVMGLDLVGNRMRFFDKDRNQETVSDDLLENVSPWIERAVDLGVQSLVVLDLSYVGTSRGAGSAQACELISRQWPSLELISGGGVRHAADIEMLFDAGCDRVLVATALHQDDSAAQLFSLH